jgi:hypothetical protein
MAVIVLEVFSLVSDVDEKEFRARDEQVQEDAQAHRSGLMRRTLARNDRAWLVLWLYASRKDADASLPDGHPSLDEFIDQSTYRKSSFETL